MKKRKQSSPHRKKENESQLQKGRGFSSVGRYTAAAAERRRDGVEGSHQVLRSSPQGETRRVRLLQLVVFVVLAVGARVLSLVHILQILQRRSPLRKSLDVHAMQGAVMHAPSSSSSPAGAPPSLPPLSRNLSEAVLGRNIRMWDLISPPKILGAVCGQRGDERINGLQTVIVGPPVRATNTRSSSPAP
ncbi:hypothetical protein EYF80_049539 [Liparis tanakae]|uniref:Uncharacterized protein n=1 Tax=Liparis tanakae TaxID=230148 RepID=A0A4Z2FJ30_9TELE|nr:hypothetical protein EYF80_049539 [Liparis tanakae]